MSYIETLLTEIGIEHMMKKKEKKKETKKKSEIKSLRVTM
jgi:hypothetical protein